MRAKTVLVFDDDLDLLDIFRFLFEGAGWKVHTSNNCSEVVSKVREVAPDVILMDNWIPPTGGIVATQALKKDSELLPIPIIFVSANNDIKDLAAKAGADAYLPKPFDFVVFIPIAVVDFIECTVFAILYQSGELPSENNLLC
ncbi:Response regulator receiver domain-containing protein [Dyadobacter sp. SG02]|uniref:response regulator n=1 Tax=Dyadobacter sp. SG02 TaxID=1855291 RepID=UPI0008C6391B|nr:response regulator [Dyadobacter sp. SG02]SEJ36559.1 Response regulator receiver domain-containing protein [Dyadobacter sp. SG02]